MDETQFENLIQRCHDGTATKEEKELVERWLQTRSAKDPFSKLSAEERESIRAHMLHNVNTRRSSSAKAGGANTRTLYRIAATLLILIAAAFTLWKYEVINLPGTQPVAEITSVTTASSIKKIHLADGSIVWLKDNSTLTYPDFFSGDVRKVSLIGEALFEVSKDPEHPFIIECGELTTTVLGTSFNIRTTENHIEVVVLTGKVSLTSVTDKDGIIVLPEEKAVYKKGSKQLAKVEAAPEEKQITIAGTEYSMDFTATPMREIIRRIEGKFSVEVDMSDEKIGNCTITADFTDQSLDRTLDMISQTLGFEYKIENNRITLTGAGC